MTNVIHSAQQKDALDSAVGVGVVRSSPDRSRESTTRSNDLVGWSLTAVVAASPIPFASNRPFFWGLWAAVVGAIGLWYSLRVASGSVQLRISFRALGPVCILFTVVALFMVAQLLPIGRLVPIGFQNQFGDLVEGRTLSIAPGDTAMALLRWLTYGCVFFLMSQVGLREQRTRGLLLAFVGLVTAEALYALAALTQLGDTILFFEKTDYRGFATGTFVNRNSLATHLGLGIVTATALLVRDDSASGGIRGPANRPFVLLGLFTMVVALIATQSRMGLIAVLAGAGVTLFLCRSRATGGWKIAGVLAGVVIALGLYGAGVGERFLGAERAAGIRIELYRQVAAMIWERPLLGYGAGSFGQAFPLFHEPALRVDLLWDYSHSTYLALWSGLGVIVGTIPLLIVAFVCYRIFRSNSAGRKARSAESAAALGATIAVGLHSTVDFSLEMPAVALLYTALLALGAASAFNLRPKNKPATLRQTAASPSKPRFPPRRRTSTFK